MHYRIELMLRCVAAGSLLLSASASLTAQPERTVEVRSSPSCRGCTIELAPVATLGRPADAELLGPYSYDVATDGRGRFVAAGGFHDRLLVYDSTGTLVRVVGRRGQGPGEFGGVLALRSVGDTLHVVDRANPLRVLSPTLDFVRSVRTPAGFDVRRAAYLRSGEVVVQTSPGVIQVLRPDGEPVRSLRVPAVDEQTACPGCELRALAAASDAGRFWSTVSNRYEIDLFDVEGRHHLRLTRNAPWFAPWRTLRPSGSPRPRVDGIREDANGLLWIKLLVPDPAPVPLSAAESTRVLYPALLERTWDATLEVIDPRTGQLLASRQVPNLIYFAGRDLVVTQHEDGDGIVTLVVLRATLRRP